MSEKLGLSVNEACDVMGVSRTTLTHFLKRKENPIPCIVTPGGKRGRYIIPSRTLERWMDEEAERCSRKMAIETKKGRKTEAIRDE